MWVHDWTFLLMKMIKISLIHEICQSQSTSPLNYFAPRLSDITERLLPIITAQMDASTFQPRGVGPGPYPDVTKIPTPPLQRIALFIMFFLPALATVVVGLRIYTRVIMRTLGVGM